MLTSEEARQRLAADGPNALPGAVRRGLLAEVGAVLREPMLLLLLGAAGLYAALGEPLESAVLGAWVLAMIALNVFQQRRTAAALAALADLTAPAAVVVRDGERRRIPAAEVVRGDTVVVREGDRVPADARLVDGAHVSCDESLLTGESVPVRKVAADPGAPPADAGGDDTPWLWSGTLAVAGQGTALVHATGPRSAVGRIGATLAGLSAEPTRLERETRRAVRMLGTVALGCCAALVVGLGLTRGDWQQAALAAIALAMSMIPEEFPVVLTVFHALGARRLAQRGVLVRRMAAVEALGSTTVLCTDKTGTLTANQMAVARLWGGGEEHRAGDGPLPDEVHAVLEHGVLASPRDAFDPMELAFQRLARERLAGTEHLHDRWVDVRDYPLSPALLAVAHVWRDRDGAPGVVAAKGAVEAILDLCHLDPAAAGPILARAEAWAADGLRVLAVARAPTGPGPLPEHPHGYPFAFVGLVGLQDPLRPGVPTAVADCRAAGIRVVMITGDAPATAAAIARAAGLADAEVLAGPELAALDDDALRARMRTVTVVARAVPDHKLRIVRALQADGQVVAMTGDGVNDAPALRAADIGVAMGGRGTDVAREAAALVVTDDDFSSIVAGVAEGRRIRDNLGRAFAFVLAVHVPALGLALLPLLSADAPLVLLPFHVASLELLIDPACSVAFEGQPPAPDAMRRPPRPADAPLFGRRRVAASLLHGGVVLAIAAGAFAAARPWGDEVARGLAFAALLAGSAGLVGGHRGSGRNVVATALAAGAIALAALVLASPAVGRLFQVAPPPAWAGALALASAWAGARAAAAIVAAEPAGSRRAEGADSARDTR